MPDVEKNLGAGVLGLKALRRVKSLCPSPEIEHTGFVKCGVLFDIV